MRCTVDLWGKQRGVQSIAAGNPVADRSLYSVSGSGPAPRGLAHCRLESSLKSGARVWKGVLKTYDKYQH